MLDGNGQPAVDRNGKPKLRQVGSSCPLLKKRDHGSWYYYVKLPDGQRPRKGGFLTQKRAEEAAQEIWDEAQGGLDVQSKETVGEYLHRWFKRRVNLKRSTRGGYEKYADLYFIPKLGHLQMRELRERPIQAMFEEIWAFNEIKAANRLAAQQAKAACDAAYRAWKSAPQPRPPELRQNWVQAREALREARKKPRRDTGPGTQKRILDVLSAVLQDAVSEKLIATNWAQLVVLPRYERPEPLVWTDERVARWRETGEKPGPVMVWTPEHTGQFLDAAVEHRFYIMWHLMVFRAPRRGEATGLPWNEVDMAQGTARIVEQLVADSSYAVWADTPKSRSGKRTLTLDSATHALLYAWQDVQKAQRAEWEAKHLAHPETFGPYNNSGYVFTQPDGSPWHPQSVSKAFERLIKRLGLPPIRLHDLRHCAASLSLAAGLSMKAIQALLGHASFELTANTYTSLMPQFAKEAADATVNLVPRQAAPQQPTDPDGTAAPSPMASEPREGGQHLTLVTAEDASIRATAAA